MNSLLFLLYQKRRIEIFQGGFFIKTSNLQKIKRRLIKVVSMLLVLISVSVIFMTPLVSAASTDYAPSDTNYVATALASLNIRTGPGTSYDIVGSVDVGDILYLTNYETDSAGRKYWKLAGGGNRWVSQGSSGHNFTPVMLEDTDFRADTITGYDIFGQQSFVHVCWQKFDLWYYHIEVKAKSYIVSCDCGWWSEIDCVSTSYIDPDGDGVFDTLQYGFFLGLDTDNDEMLDLRPGEKKDLPCRATSDLRQYQILEFFGQGDTVPPSVTFEIFDKSSNYIGTYTFDWSAYVRVESYGIVFTDKDGFRKICPLNGHFTVYDESHQRYVLDEELFYQHGSLMDSTEYHRFFRLTVTYLDIDKSTPLDWAVYLMNKLGNMLFSFFNFFGLSEFFTADDSPFRFLFGG